MNKKPLIDLTKKPKFEAVNSLKPQDTVEMPSMGPKAQSNGPNSHFSFPPIPLKGRHPLVSVNVGDGSGVLQKTVGKDPGLGKKIRSQVRFADLEEEKEVDLMGLSETILKGFHFSSEDPPNF